jgi:hypothetical protein
MFPIEMRRWSKRNEELRSIRIWSGIRHAQDASAGVLQCWMNFIGEFLSTTSIGLDVSLPVNGLTAASSPGSTSK